MRCSSGILGFLFSAVLLLASTIPSLAFADSAAKPTKSPLKKLFPSMSIFDKKMNARSGMFEIIDVDKQKLAKEFEAPKEVQQPKPQLTEGQLKAQRIEQNLRYVSDKPGENPVRAPGTVQSIRVSPDAPAPAKGMIGAIRLGDKELASQYAEELLF